MDERAIGPGKLGVLLRADDDHSGPRRFWFEWAWPLPEHHLSSFGIRPLIRVRKGNEFTEWGQTKSYDLRQGHVFYSQPQAYSRQTSDLLDGYAIQVVAAIPPNPPDPGKVDYKLYELAGGAWKVIEEQTKTFGAFVALLRTGA